MKQKIKYKLLILAGVLAAATVPMPKFSARASECADVRIVFARGSGGERWVDKNYLEYKSTIEKRLQATSLSYEFVDLDYPAVGVGLNNLGVTIGAFVGAGEAYEFGDSVATGVENLTKMVNSECPGSKYVLGGYSQGAMVVSKALPSLNANKVIYAATFGDPKIYLPEGAGPVPVACGGKGLSDYRMYVPDCQAYKGLLGAYMPYRPESFAGKVGTWCNKKDIFCSSRFSISDHVSYVTDELYADASKVIFDKICKAFGLSNQVSSPHDTVIMLDSTGSMGRMIEKYKSEAVRLASETLNSGGRVALYDYRDLEDPYEPVEHCNFETCTLELFEQKINGITVDGGGDVAESLLSASFFAMKNLKWQFGATKSVVVLTDAPFLLPDRDGITLDEVVRLSKEIDPVNFYIITNDAAEYSYVELAERTDGMVVTDFGKLNLLTDYIMSRYDSLPKVEEGDFEALPEIEITGVVHDFDKATVNFKSSSGRAMAILNDAVLGVVEGEAVTIGGLVGGENMVTLVPLTESLRGEGVSVAVGAAIGRGSVVIPKAPNTGIAY